jgi:hypothetical protein
MSERDGPTTVSPGAEKKRPRILAAIGHQREAIGKLSESLKMTHARMKGIHAAIDDGNKETNKILQSIESKLDQALSKIPGIEMRLDELEGKAANGHA